MLDTAVRSACEHIRGKFVGLPGARPDASPSAAPVTAADQGLADVGGRWQIRDCEQTIDQGTLVLRMSGPGWQWVDRSEGGFRIQQHVLFQAKVDLRGTLDIGYDPAARIASIWLTPSGDASASVTPLGSVNPRPEDALATMKASIAPLVGKNPAEIAKAQVGIEGARQFQKSLSQGLTITYAIDTGQQDLLLGVLPNGVVPKRPYETPTGSPWVLNEYQALAPGAFQLAGPFSPGPAKLEVSVEQGPGLRAAALCARDGERLVDTLLRGDPVDLSGYPVASETLAVKSPKTTATIASPPCPWILATENRGTEVTRAALELTMQLPAAGSTDAVQPAGGTASSTAPPAAAWVKITLVHFRFEQRKPDGATWDPFGGAPDPQISVGTRTTRPSILLPVQQDLFEADAAAQSAVFEITPTDEIVLVANDVDAVGGDSMGTARITFEQVLAATGSIEVPLQIGATTTGSLRVRIERAPRP
jgi:hypothetical protein